MQRTKKGKNSKERTGAGVHCRPDSPETAMLWSAADSFQSGARRARYYTLGIKNQQHNHVQ